MRVAIVQLASGTDAQANLETVRRLVDRAAASGPDLVVLPEAAMHDFGEPDTPLGPVAQALDGPFVSTLAGLARRHRATVVGGMFETSDDPDRPWNTLVALHPDGTLADIYRKAHLYDAFGYRESDRLLAGDPRPVLLGLGDVRVGLLTCYDLRFPEVARVLIDAGATCLAVPAAWVRGPLKEDHWSTLLRARAIESTAYVAGAAQSGQSYCGGSMLVDPLGVVVAGLGEQEGIAVGEVDPARVDSVRRSNPALEHRRFRVVPR